MLVCVCNGIREKDFRSAVREGATGPYDAYARLGRRPKCGQCVSFAKTLIADERVPA
ncbi:MAG: (2Fe-2S)-binding protein [Sphingobium sp.]